MTTVASGFEVVIRYRGSKYLKVASPAAPSSEFAILKKDLVHLRVHSPSQKNVHRVEGSFVLRWPGVALSTKDSLHTRWFKLCSDDPEARKLRDTLSIDVITLIQDGVVIGSTAGTLPGLPPRPVLPPLVIPPPALPPAPSIVRLPPTAPRSDRQVLPPPRPYPRRMTNGEGASEPTLDPQSTTPLGSPTPQQTKVPLREDQVRPATPGWTTSVIPPVEDAPMPVEQTSTTPTPAPLPIPLEPEPELGPVSELTPEQDVVMSISPEPGALREPVKISTPLSSISTADPIRSPGSAPILAPPPATRPASHTKSRVHTPTMPSGDAARVRERDVSRLMRELWDTRRQKTALQAREQVILDDLERLGTRPETTGLGNDSCDEVARLGAELRSERARRMRAEQALSDVERECRKPFVVPALYEAFLSISELTR